MPGMTRFRARLTLFAIIAIFVATASNALFLQDRVRLFPSTAVSVTQFPADKSSSLAPDSADGGSVPAQSEEAKGSRLYTALERELRRRGYSGQLQVRANGLRLAVLAYEFDNGLPLTGEPSETLLKRVLFDMNQGPRGAFADRAELSSKLVIETQKMLLGLGFFRGTFSGRMDIWTSNAIKDFERHRGIPLSGRLTEATLLELITYSGQTILLSSG